MGATGSEPIEPQRLPAGAWSAGLKWLARACFAAAVLALAYGLWLRRAAPSAAPTAPQPVREKPLAIDWGREPFREWSSPEDGFRLLYPARFDPERGFGRFTSRDIAGGIVETDMVAFRSMQPRSVIMIAGYQAPRPLSWDEWISLAKDE